MAVLVALAARPGDVVTRDELIATVWGGRIVTDDALNRCIARLRDVLGAGGATDPIVTVPRVGYRLVLPVTVDDADAGPHARRIPRMAWVAVGVIGVGALLAAGIALQRLGIKPRGPGDTAVSAAAAPPGTLAVMPLQNMTGDLGNEFLSDGLADELRDQLASLPGIRVTSRNSAYAFKGKGIKAEELGRRLGVARLLAGSMRRAGDRFTVTVQLVDTGSGLATWSRGFELTPASAMDLQRDIATAVAAQMQLVTRPAPGTQHAPNAAAYRQYLLGRYAFERRRNAAGIEDAIRYFQEAVRADADFGPGHALLAAALAILPAYRESVDRILSCEQAEKSGRRALALEGMNGLAYAVIGYCEAGVDMVAAERNLQHGLSLAPQLVEAHLWYGQLLLDVGRIDAAIGEGERAAALDPQSGPVYAFLAEASYLKGDFGRALELAGRSQSLGVADMNQVLSKVALARGKVEESARLWSASDGIDLAVARLVSEGLVDAAKLAAARAPLEAEVNRVPWPARGWSRLNMRLLLGDLEGALAALDELERRVGRQQALQGFAAADLWDPQSQVRGHYRDARFQTLLARTGLLNYYHTTGIAPDLCQFSGEALACAPRSWRAGPGEDAARL